MELALAQGPPKPGGIKEMLLFKYWQHMKYVKLLETIIPSVSRINPERAGKIIEEYINLLFPRANGQDLNSDQMGMMRDWLSKGSLTIPEENVDVEGKLPESWIKTIGKKRNTPHRDPAWNGTIRAKYKHA